MKWLRYCEDRVGPYVKWWLLALACLDLVRDHLFWAAVSLSIALMAAISEAME